MAQNPAFYAMNLIAPKLPSKARDAHARSRVRASDTRVCPIGDFVGVKRIGVEGWLSR